MAKIPNVSPFFKGGLGDFLKFGNWILVVICNLVLGIFLIQAPCFIYITDCLSRYLWDTTLSGSNSPQTFRTTP